MQSKIIKKEIPLTDGRTISVETGKLAKQADGSAVVRLGDTMLLATVVSKKEAAEGIDFMPLSVDYQEKFASAGKIPGGYIKREGRLSDHEILISRLVDRAIRPMFPDDYHAETQVNIFLISADKEVMPDALAAFAASSAIAVSDIPFKTPISEVRIARSGTDFIVNPNAKQTEEADLDLIVAASEKNILMVEGEMNEVSEDDMVQAMKTAHTAIIDQCQIQHELAQEAEKTKKRDYEHESDDQALYEKMRSELYDKVNDVVQQCISDKHERSDAIRAIKDEFIDNLPEDHEYDASLIGKYFKEIEKEVSRKLVLEQNKRLDNRKLDEIRPISSEVDYLPSAHGSSLFTRGETQSLTTVTLGTKLDEQMIDSAMIKGSHKFMLHYNFPAFSTGEVKPNRGPARREVGHGNLAFRAIRNMLPSDQENPYTIRVVSDILESNGSSSMATVCAAALALMDSGIKIKSPVSGIAMGMIADEETGNYAILSDILGDEDHLGDMDFKVAGTRDGITACQMDIKVDGLSYEVLSKALEQAKAGRIYILDEMAKTISEPNQEFKPNAPRSASLEIEKDTIGALIGPGGKVVQEIQKETGATVIIEEGEKMGLVNIFAQDQEAMDNALKRVKDIVAVPEVGEIYDGKVKSIMPFGAFIEFLPGKDGLLHISEIKWERVESMDGLMEVGEDVRVKLVDIDKKTGKYRLSRKVLLPKPEKMKGENQTS